MSNQAGDNAGNSLNARWATVGGGSSNTASDHYATVGGGQGNTATGERATVGGGAANTASREHATVGGGWGNTASGIRATVGGGYGNTASGNSATVPGGIENTAQGDYSFAAGRQAKANHDGAFVWGDSTNANITSSANDAFIVRASGGVTMYTSSDLSSGATLPKGSGTWSSLSARDAKENFTPIDGQEVLARLAEVPISTWNYKTQDPSTRHMGPVAQDFYAAFGLGESERYISTVDADGVALAAIQELYQVTQKQAARIQTLEAENAALQQQLDDLEARVTALETTSADSTAASARTLRTGLLPGAGILLAGLGLGWFNRRGDALSQSEEGGR